MLHMWDDLALKIGGFTGRLTTPGPRFSSRVDLARVECMVCVVWPRMARMDGTQKCARPPRRRGPNLHTLGISVHTFDFFGKSTHSMWYTRLVVHQ